MKTSFFTKLSVIAVLFIFICSGKSYSQEIKDYDGNIYKTVSHGVQTWTAYNLSVTHFRNGDLIPQAKTPEEWVKFGSEGKPAWCFYDNDPENGKKYGVLYNWYAINDQRGLAPKGYHIPNNADWSLLVRNLFGVDIAGTKLKSKTAWKSKTGTDDIGFAAVPSGYRDQDGKFRESGIACWYWSNSVPLEVKPSNQIYSVVLNDNTVEVKYLKSEKGAGFSVRCEKD